MPDSNINLNNILREERKLKKPRTQESKFVPLESDFYVKIARQIYELEEEKSKIEDIYSTKYAMIEDELKTARKALENLINLRTAKIITEASIRSSLKQREKYDPEAMTLEERRFYNRLLELMTEWWEWRRELIDRVKVREKQTAPAFQEAAQQKNGEQGNGQQEAAIQAEGQQEAAMQEAVLQDDGLPGDGLQGDGLQEDGLQEDGLQGDRPEVEDRSAHPDWKGPQEAVHVEKKQKENLPEGKKDINKEYIVVRLLKDIPTFVGVDGRNYTLAKEDVAVLSAVNAKALINRNAAIQISVKR
jgi:DNA replication factor GINS